MTEYALLAELDDEQRRILLAAARRRRFARGEVVFHDGDPGDALHLVAKGHFAVRVNTSLGDRVMLRVLRPGECFGELALLVPGPRRGTVVALEGGETLVFDRDRIVALQASHPAFERMVVAVLVAEVRRLSNALVEALHLPAEQRVWRRVLDLATAYGDADGVVLPITQDDVAQLAGTTRSTVNRLLRAAESDGVVRLARGRIEVLDAAAVEARAR